MSFFRRSLALLKASRQVVAMQPRLLVYPLISLGAFLLTVAVVFMPGVVGYLTTTNVMFSDQQMEQWFTSVPFYILLALFIVITQFVTNFCNVAFFDAAETALNGEEVSVKKTLGTAWSRKKRIFQWTFFSAAVGFALLLIQDKLGWFGTLLSFIGGLAWALATFFALPILIRHDVGPVEVLKRSSSVFKKTWGENVVAGISLGIFMLISFFLFLVIPGILIGTSLASGALTVTVAIILGAISFLVLGLSITYFSTMQIIFSQALFRYAETGDYVGPFSKELIDMAFKPKPKMRLPFTKA